MKPWWSTVIIALGGCGLTVGNRADQGNFTIHASKPQVERLLAKLSTRFGASHAYDLDGSDSDPNRVFRVDGSTATVILVPVPDDRCNPNARLNSTFDGGEYRIDLVYRSKSQPDRTSAKNALIKAAHDDGLKITDFKEC